MENLKIKEERRSKTLLIDIDGTLIEHHGNHVDQTLKPPVILSGVMEKFLEWDSKGYRIILITGRRESSRAITEQQLLGLGLFWDLLIMGVGGGERVLINDLKPHSDKPMATAINIKRNVGLAEVEI